MTIRSSELTPVFASMNFRAKVTSEVSSAGVSDPMVRKGFTRAAKHTSDLYTFPKPARIDCVSRAGPTSSSGCVPNRTAAAWGSNSFSQHIRPELTDAPMPAQARRGMELGNLNLKGDGDERSRVNSHAHLLPCALPRFAGPVDMPAPAHQHVGQQHQIAGEIHQHPLARWLNGLNRAAGNWGIFIHACEGGKLCFESGHNFVPQGHGSTCGPFGIWCRLQAFF